MTKEYTDKEGRVWTLHTKDKEPSRAMFEVAYVGAALRHFWRKLHPSA